MSELATKPGSNCIDVVLDVPMRQTFSYLCGDLEVGPGVRVKVPFGRRKMVGLVVARREHPPENIKLREIETVLDEQALFSSILMRLVDWTAAYYHHPVGEVWRAAMPAVLRKGLVQTHGLLELVYVLGVARQEALDQLGRARLQSNIIKQFGEGVTECTRVELLRQFPGGGPAIKALLEKGYLICRQRMVPVMDYPPAKNPNTLSPEQAEALDLLTQSAHGFQRHVLEGITGSGKTEVYFALIDACLARQQQALILVPEIALTDQLFQRFSQRFGSRVVQVHSAMGDAVRYQNWWRIRSGMVDVVLATRSGIFLEFDKLGLIVVDEEHDLSYKQHEGVRYHARSLAIKRAQLHDIPIVLGSATPSLETVYNIQQGQFSRVPLSQRIGRSELPNIELLDMNQARLQSGLSQTALDALSKTLEQQRQALVFINRRGYAPVLFCRACQWTAQCRRCDAQMTLHQNTHSLQCHHCGLTQRVPRHCESCGEEELIPLGEGTQKVEEQLQHALPQARIQRFDRDELSTARKLQQAMNKVHAHEIDILVGTQLLSKGHDFSRVNLVLVVNADQGLHSIDFRAPELLVQQLIQVAGRAGRGVEKGHVMIQTRFPQHPSLLAVKHYQYAEFTRRELEQRRLAGFPPYAHLALWRVRGAVAASVMQSLETIAKHGRSVQPAGTLCYDPVKSPMFKRAGQFHAQLLISAVQRSALHQWLQLWITRVEQDKLLRSIKWSIDVDPMSLF